MKPANGALKSLLALGTVVVLVASCSSGATTAPSSAAPSSAAPSSAAPSSADVIGQVFGPGGTAAGQGLIIKVGDILSMTGQGSYYGDVMSKGAKLAAAQIKAAGGPDFQIEIADHQSGDVNAAEQGFRRLTSQEGIKYLQISYSSIGDALAPLVAQSKVLTFQGGGTSPGQLRIDYLWNNRMVTGVSNAPGGLTWLHNQYPNAKKLAIVGTTESAQYAIQTLVPKDWPIITPGGTIIDTEIHDVGITDYSQVIARLKAAAPDAIWTADFGNDPGYFMKQLRETGITVPVIGLEYTADACKIGGSAYDTFTFATDYFDTNTQSPWGAYFVKTYKDAYGATPDFYAANYYEEVYILWELVKGALAEGKDPQDPTVLQDVVKSIPSVHSLYGGDATTTGTMMPDLTQHTFAKPMGVFTVSACVPKPVAEIQVPTSEDNPTSAFVKNLP